MNFRLFILLFLAGPLAWAETAPTAVPDDLVSPANKIIAGETDAAWRPLLTEIQSKGSISATFTENRYFPFKKIPVVFTGEMRLSPEHGLSLHYISPENRMLIVDSSGVLIRDDQGRNHELPADPRAQAATSALLHIMRFDFDALAKDFDLYGRRDGTGWQLVFDPKPGELAGVLARIIVTGKDARVSRIQMRKSAVQNVEIVMGEPRENLTFPADELKKFFR